MLILVLVLFLLMLLSGLPIIAAMGVPALIYMWIEGMPASTMA